MTNSNGYLFFLGGPFSNWHKCNFSVNNILYDCGEQYMMHQKALVAGDFVTAAKVLKEPDPAKQKALGRQISGYDDAKWSAIRYDIVKNGLREKYKQNKILMDYLLSCNGKIIVEASPADAIWGIGFDANNAMANINKWGQNLLGKIHVDLCKEFLKNNKE